MMLKRDFLKAISIAAAAAPLLTPQEVFGQTPVLPTILWMRRGGEEVKLDYSTAAGYKHLCWLLRDINKNVTGYPDWRLLQLLSWMQAWLAGYDRHIRYDALSGMRLKSTNMAIEGAALNSKHIPDKDMVFRAIDTRNNVVSSEYLGRLAWMAQQGGVGFYVRDFSHFDTGPRIASWRAK